MLLLIGEMVLMKVALLVMTTTERNLNGNRCTSNVKIEKIGGVEEEDKSGLHDFQFVEKCDIIFH